MNEEESPIQPEPGQPPAKRGRRRFLVGMLVAAVVGGGLVAWQPWERTRAQWLRKTISELQQAPPPPASVTNYMDPGEWAERGGYLIFNDGWAYFKAHTFHASERIGDIAVIRASDGSLYVSKFHFCVGLQEYAQYIYSPEERQSRPQNIGHFIELYGKKYHWARLPADETRL